MKGLGVEGLKGLGVEGLKGSTVEVSGVGVLRVEGFRSGAPLGLFLILQSLGFSV